MAFFIPSSYLTALDNLGNVISGARCYFYDAGTTNALQTYSNYTLTSPNATPYITADAYGRFPPAYVADGTFLRFVIKSADGATTYIDADKVLAPEQPTASVSPQTYVTQNSNFGVDSSMLGQLVGVDDSGGNIAVTADSNALGNGFWFSIRKNGASNQITITPQALADIDGASSYVLDTQYEIVTLISRGSAGWAIAGETKREEMGEIVLVEYTAASVTLQLSDKGKMLKMNRATAQSLIVPTNASVPFPIGTRIEFFQYGAGEVTVSPFDGTVNIRAPNNWVDTTVTYSAGVLTKIGTNEWLLSGDMEA